MDKNVREIITAAAIVIGTGLLIVLCLYIGRATAPVEIVYRDREVPVNAMNVRIDGKTVDVPDGYEIVYESENTEEVLAVVSDIRRSAAAQGASAYQSGRSITGDWQAPPLNMELDGISATGGGFQAKFKALSEISVTSILTVLGALAIIGGAIALFKGWRAIGLGLIVGGIVACTAAFLYETYPWLVAILAVVAFGVFGYFIYRLWKTKQLEADAKAKAVALQVIAKGVQKAEPAKGGPVRTAIKDTANTLGVEPVVDAQVAKALT